MNQSRGMCLLVASFLVLAAMPVRAGDVAADATEPVAGAPVFTSHGLLGQLEGFLHQRELDSTRLTADSMVGAMIDWMRFEPVRAVQDTPASDTLVYQYGGWSEGCATGFKLSLLRKVSAPDAGGEQFAQTAGITLIFEPSANTDLAPFKLASSDAKSIDDFLAAIESSPAYQKLASTTPMSVVIESGGMR